MLLTLLPLADRGGAALAERAIAADLEDGRPVLTAESVDVGNDTVGRALTVAPA